MPNQGPLTREQLMALWRSITDPSYHRPLLEDDGNLEIVEQIAEQFARASESIDRNTQAFYILPWSGQTNPSAKGGRKATVSVTVTRTQAFERSLVLTKGLVIEHRLNDWGPEGPVEVTTQRRYVATETVTLGPGAAGPVSWAAVAEREGYGYNEPTPGSLNTVLQPGAGFENDGGSVSNGVGSTNRLICTPVPDVPVFGHVGQYLQFTAGLNTGLYRRILGVIPSAGDTDGGSFDLAAEALLLISSVAGAFEAGEPVLQTPSGARGTALGANNGKLLVLKTSGTFNGAGTIAGEASGATATVNALEQSDSLTAEVGTASWRVVPWSELGLKVTNDAQPEGGRSAMLDELGSERAMPRSEGESNEEYADRVSKPADTVSPNAIRRAANRVLAQFDEEACLREVGTELFKGIFYDGAPSNEPFAFDLGLVEIVVTPDGYQAGELLTQGPTTGRAVVDATSGAFRGAVRVNGPGFDVGAELVGARSGVVGTISSVGPGLLPEHRFIVMLDLVEFRGFFLVGVPPFPVGSWGAFMDDHPDGFLDTQDLDNFFDGEAVVEDAVVERVYNAVDRVRAGGVGFDVYVETFGCI